MRLADSELILNPDRSIYHLHLKPGEVAQTILTVGDQNRVAEISKHFESLEVIRQHREFITHTGRYQGKRITVISTGIGGLLIQPWSHSTYWTGRGRNGASSE